VDLEKAMGISFYCCARILPKIAAVLSAKPNSCSKNALGPKVSTMVEVEVNRYNCAPSFTFGEQFAPALG
jgi:hypothetical protein